MKITQEEVVDRQTVLHIELEDDDMAPYLDHGYRKVVQHVAIPGFRKGKAPRSVVERYLGRESLIQESLNHLLPEVTERAVEAQQLEATGVPNVELLELDPVTVKATVPLTPAVDIGEYTNIRIEETPVETTEDDVQQRLEELRRTDAPWEPVERPVQLGDMVTLDALGHVEETAVMNSDDQVYTVEADSPLPFPGFAEKLVDMEAGAARDFTLVLPEDHVNAGVAGKMAHFDVTIKDIKERSLPDLDDEFAKGVGDGYETLAELRQSVEEELKGEAERAQATQFREAALDEFVVGATFEFPPLLIDHEVQHMVQRRDQFVEQLNVSMDDYLRFTGKTESEIREEMHEHAIERLSRSYALTTLAGKEGMAVSDQDIDERVQELLSSRREPEDGEADPGIDLESEEARNSIRESLLVERSVDRLVAIAKGELAESKPEEESIGEGEDDPDEGGDADDAKS